MVHFALGLDGRRRHGTDGRREDESAQERLRSLTYQKLEELPVVESNRTRRDDTSFSSETLRVTIQEACLTCLAL
jgi:hypothetical protein